MKWQRMLISLVLAVSTITLCAQTPRPAFEVASIKKLDQAVTSMVFGYGPPVSNGTLRMTNSPVAALVQYAYSLRDFQVVGGPDWTAKDLFEVQAKAAGEPAVPEMKVMLQSLLQDRFGLVMHKEQRDMRFFALVSARSDGRPGPYLHRMHDTGPCDRKEFEEVENTRSKPSTGYAMAGFSCGTLANFAESSSRLVELPIFDRTGLTGRWSATLYYAPDPNLGTTRLIGAPDPSLASFPIALQEQLGLKLEATRGPVDVMVIDSVHQPTEN